MFATNLRFDADRKEAPWCLAQGAARACTASVAVKDARECYTQIIDSLTPYLQRAVISVAT